MRVEVLAQKLRLLKLIVKPCRLPYTFYRYLDGNVILQDAKKPKFRSCSLYQLGPHSSSPSPRRCKVMRDLTLQEIGGLRVWKIAK